MIANFSYCQYSEHIIRGQLDSNSRRRGFQLAVFIIIFEMQNFNSNYQSVPLAPLSSPRGQEDCQKIFHQLRDLQEVQDESRNELCPVFLDEESLIKTRRDSNWSANQVPTHVDILKEL